MERQQFRQVDVANTTVMINPHPHDLAKLLVQSPKLRALASGSTFAIWPAEESLHQTIQQKLDMEDRAKRYFVISRRQGRFKVGRFCVDVDTDNRATMEPWMMTDMMQRALGITP